MIGVKETKEAVIALVDLANRIDESLADGFQWTDAFNLIPALTKFPAAIDGYQQIPEEIFELDEMERSELIAEIMNLDFDSDKSEEILEQALRVIMELGKLVTIVK